MVGALLVWSATHHTSGATHLVRHLVNTAAGMGLAWLVARLGRYGLRLLTPWLYGVSLLGLVAVLTPVGTTVNGSHSWIPLGAGVTVQPSEFAKVGLILLLAGLFADRWDRGVAPGGREVLLAWCAVGLPLALVMLQPDLGSAVVLAAIGFVVIALAGAARKWVLLVAAGMIGAVVAAFTTPLLSTYQRDRLTAFLDPAADPTGFGYQTHQVRVAIGNGGWWGQGFMEGSQTQGGVIPYQLNDFVFSVAAEELGLVGAGGLIVLLGFVVVRIFVTGMRARDSFGTLVATGVGTWLAFQVFQNVGMTLGLLPVTGLPLPFVSYGGSSMFACWLGIGIVNAAHVAEAEAP